MNATTTATTVSRIARCKDCGTVTKVTRETRTYCGWPQERLTEKVTNEFGERSEWVGTAASWQQWCAVLWLNQHHSTQDSGQAL
jgi:hypothetical protein